MMMVGTPGAWVPTGAAGSLTAGDTLITVVGRQWGAGASGDALLTQHNEARHKLSSKAKVRTAGVYRGTAKVGAPPPGCSSAGRSSRGKPCVDGVEAYLLS